MTATTKTEKEIVLKLFKEFNVDYNSSNIAKEVNKTRVGAYKALNFLEKDTIVKGKNMGKARFYQLNLEDEYARKNVETLLMEEAKKFQMWIDEFQEFFEYVDIVILFGSIVKNEEFAKDVDILLVYDEKYNQKINKIIKEKNEILLKKIHPVKQTKEDLINNIQIKDKVIINAIKNGVILFGYEKITEIIKDVTQ